MLFPKRLPRSFLSGLRPQLIVLISSIEIDGKEFKVWLFPGESVRLHIFRTQKDQALWGKCQALWQVEKYILIGGLALNDLFTSLQIDITQDERSGGNDSAGRSLEKGLGLILTPQDWEGQKMEASVQREDIWAHELAKVVNHLLNGDWFILHQWIRTRFHPVSHLRIDSN